MKQSSSSLENQAHHDRKEQMVENVKRSAVTNINRWGHTPALIGKGSCQTSRTTEDLPESALRQRADGGHHNIPLGEPSRNNTIGGQCVIRAWVDEASQIFISGQGVAIGIGELRVSGRIGRTGRHEQIVDEFVQNGRMAKLLN